MHESPAGFTWGDTAASGVFELPADDGAPATMHWCAGTPCTGIYLPLQMGEALPAVLEAAGSASEYVRSATAPAPINAAIDSAPDPTHLSWWWLCKGILQAAKGDRLASQFNRRQPVLRAVLNDVEETIATFLAGSRVMSGGGQADLEGAVRMAVWGLHAAQVRNCD